MAVNPKGFFYQLNNGGTPNENSKLSFGRQFTDGALTEQQLIWYSSYELKHHYDLYDGVGIKFFSLRKPFYIDLNLGKGNYHFICQAVPVSYLKRLKAEDIPFRLKKTLFVVLPLSRQIKKEQSNEKPLAPSDMNRLLNAIDSKAQQHFKQFSLVIYTGMTN